MTSTTTLMPWDETSENLSYDDWFALVDKFMWQTYGIGAEDIPDWPSRDWYDDGMRADQACESAIEHARDF